jgi:hypothetical protein
VFVPFVAFVPFVGVVRFCANAGAESNDRNSTSANRNRREEEKAVADAIVFCDGQLSDSVGWEGSCWWWWVAVKTREGYGLRLLSTFGGTWGSECLVLGKRRLGVGGFDGEDLWRYRGK